MEPIRIDPAVERLCVSITADSVQQAIDLARQSRAAASVIEIRLDALPTPDPEPFLMAIEGPLLFTNRTVREGGAFTGSEADRLAPLLKAARANAAYIDFELETAESWQQQLLATLHDSVSRWIVSWHDFNATPPTEYLEEILARQLASGAHIGKIVTMATDFTDVLRVLNLQVTAARLQFPLIAFCMGRVGMISRLATLRLGGYMTYAAPDGGRATAPGQLPVSVIRDLQEIINGAD